MRVTIVTGLLGAGKTTFIRHAASAAPLTTAVLVNDFGKKGIDGDIFAAEGIESLELPSGCICCTLKSDLITAIRKIAEDLAPDHLIIEPSGIASPAGVIDALTGLGIKRYTVVGLVDATEFLELYEAEMYGDFFREQVAVADIVLINKTDLVEKTLLQGTSDLVSLLNPGAVIYRTVNADIGEPLPDIAGSGRTLAGKGGRLQFETASWTLKQGISSVSVSGFFRELAAGNFGKVVRAKALLDTDEGPRRFDLAYGTVSEEDFGRPAGSSRLVVIGETLDFTRIRQAVSERWGAEES